MKHGNVMLQGFMKAMIGAACAVSIVLGAAIAEEGPANTAEPKMGGDLTIVWAAGGARLDNATMNSSSLIDFPVLSAIYGQLVYRTLDDQIEPLLANGIATDDGGLTWTLSLRDDVKFADGTPLDAEAVKFNLDRFKDPATGSRNAGAMVDLGYEVIDPQTVKFTLSTQNPQWDRDFARYFAFMASPTAIQADPEGFKSNPVGAGPFMVSNWIQGDSLEMVRNPHYLEERTPYLDSLTIKVYSDPDQGFNAVSSKTADLGWTIEPNIAKRAAEAGFRIIEAPTGGGSAILPNFSSPPFSDIRARQALSLAIDFQALMDSAKGAGKAATSYFEPGSPWYTESAAFPKPDAERAQQLFDELAAEGNPLSFTLNTNVVHRDYSEAIQAQLLAFDNVEVEVEVLDNAAHTSKLRSGDFDLIFGGATWESPYPGIEASYSTSGSINYSAYSNKKVDEALEAGKNALDRASAVDAYAEAQAEMAKDIAFYNVTHWSHTWYPNPGVVGVFPIGNGSGLIWDRLGFAE